MLLPICLAIRQEGKFVNAYHVKNDAGDGAYLLGSIHAGLLCESPELYAAWRDLMCAAYACSFSNFIGEHVTPQRTEH